jgi:hypothetical protein
VKLARIPLVAILRGIDAAFGIAQWIDGLLDKRKARARASELLEKQARATAPTVVLRRRQPTTPRP